MKKYLKYFSNTALILKYFFEIQHLKYFKYFFAQYLLLILKYSLKYLLTTLSTSLLFEKFVNVYSTRDKYLLLLCYLCTNYLVLKINSCNNFFIYHLTAKHLNRQKRSTNQNTCHILAVADYTFFNGPGGGLPHSTANYIVSCLKLLETNLSIVQFVDMRTCLIINKDFMFISVFVK